MPDDFGLAVECYDFDGWVRYFIRTAAARKVSEVQRPAAVIGITSLLFDIDVHSQVDEKDLDFRLRVSPGFRSDETGLRAVASLRWPRIKTFGHKNDSDLSSRVEKSMVKAAGDLRFGSPTAIDGVEAVLDRVSGLVLVTNGNYDQALRPDPDSYGYMHQFGDAPFRIKSESVATPADLVIAAIGAIAFAKPTLVVPGA